ncbi:MAG TPA: flavin reductase family protein [Brevundimonas sp.]|uniref:flavin reductase family protein n=1 Tax=Brevundimonas sp. TaxID=1871086 RepID=UPI00260C50DE|nr:flavin reductase family protein [Brevundimonas sp.]HRO32659.1 flavin reductase family protein [Brevundimonas sp.]
MSDAPVPSELRRAYRDALGVFSTGVCVVTAHTPDGAFGITVNSFTSVSLDPPLVLWCLDQASERHDLFAAADRFAVHVLPVEDREMSDRFAWGVCRLSPDEFDTEDPAPPRLKNALARLDCTTEQRVPMGDHLTIVGRVQAFDSRAGDALTYYRGRYGVAVDPNGASE